MVVTSVVVIKLLNEIREVALVNEAQAASEQSSGLGLWICGPIGSTLRKMLPNICLCIDQQWRNNK